MARLSGRLMLACVAPLRNSEIDFVQRLDS